MAHWIHSGTQLCSQPGFIPVPHVLIPALGTEGTARYGSVPQSDSHFSLPCSSTALSTLWGGVRGVCQPPALRSKFEDGIGIFDVCLFGIFSLLPNLVAQNTTKETLPSVTLGSL